MNSKKILIFGTLVSFVLLVIVFSRLEWSAFLSALKSIRLAPILLAGSIIMLIIILRSLRWTLVAHQPIIKFKYFWQAVNIGYLGNMIYPARAGEVLKVVAIHHFAPLVYGRAISSAVIDRMLDMIVVGLFTLLVLWIHGSQIDPNVGRAVISIFMVATVLLTLLIILVDRLQTHVQSWNAQAQWQQRLQEWSEHALEGVQAFRQTHNILIVLLLSVGIFMLDYFWMWLMMDAFGWDLPFEAGLTVGVFLLVAISLPSAPGYIGIYQVACVLALSLYGIDESLAVAYSVVMQLLTFAILGVQGMLVTAYCGFNLSRERDLSFE
ncbi:hypothetical protein PN36_05615 [Candidatus Thiomargarita nelsonii]|uniref:Uncharacterized protein n=1 Tax=Candidatus Thiomargarita nelsonii TaxID=1003181 RepID=A0A0A6PE11_9GAMM|nr:hypothetical protein PN36_05615 [Candidatus Thiomargarita nelsonii]